MKYREFIEQCQKDYLKLVQDGQIDPMEKPEHVKILNCRILVDTKTDEIVEVREKF